MKLLVTFSLTFLMLPIFGQHIYGSLSGGIQNIIPIDEINAPMVNTIYNMTQVNYSTIQPKKSFRHLYSADINFGHIGKFPFLDLEQYEQLVVNNKLTVLVEIEDKLSFQSKLFIPKEK